MHFYRNLYSVIKKCISFFFSQIGKTEVNGVHDAFILYIFAWYLSDEINLVKV